MLNKPLVIFPKKFVQVLKRIKKIFVSQPTGSWERISNAECEQMSSQVSNYATGNLLMTLIATWLIRHDV